MHIIIGFRSSREDVDDERKWGTVLDARIFRIHGVSGISLDSQPTIPGSFSCSVTLVYWDFSPTNTRAKP